MFLAMLPFEYGELLGFIQTYTYGFFNEEQEDILASYWLAKRLEKKVLGVNFVYQLLTFDQELKSFLDFDDAFELQRLSQKIQRRFPIIKTGYRGQWARIEVKGKRTLIISMKTYDNNTFTYDNSLRL